MESSTPYYHSAYLPHIDASLTPHSNSSSLTINNQNNNGPVAPASPPDYDHFSFPPTNNSVQGSLSVASPPPPPPPPPRVSPRWLLGSIRRNPLQDKQTAQQQLSQQQRQQPESPNFTYNPNHTYQWTGQEGLQVVTAPEEEDLSVKSGGTSWTRRIPWLRGTKRLGSSIGTPVSSMDDNASTLVSPSAPSSPVFRTYKKKEPPHQTFFAPSSSSTDLASDSEWTPQDSAYGAACPVCGCLPKHVRRAIELTLITITVFGVIYFVVTTSIRITSEHSSSSDDDDHLKLDDDYYIVNNNNNNKYNDDQANATAAVDDDDYGRRWLWVDAENNEAPSEDEWLDPESEVLDDDNHYKNDYYSLLLEPESLA